VHFCAPFSVGKGTFFTFCDTKRDTFLHFHLTTPLLWLEIAPSKDVVARKGRITPNQAFNGA
jgi:hypothetical protein